MEYDAETREPQRKLASLLLCIIMKMEWNKS